jgi:hypothetical protein
LHHDNAPAHTALSVREILASKQITVLEHPLYSPDLAPNYFFVFHKIKEILKVRHFDEIDDIRSNTMAALKAIPQNEFQNCFEGTLKATTVIFSSEVCSTVTAISSRTLFSDRVFLYEQGVDIGDGLKFPCNRLFSFKYFLFFFSLSRSMFGYCLEIEYGSLLRNLYQVTIHDHLSTSFDIT